jgi:AcrR family transcriptional regulator
MPRATTPRSSTGRQRSTSRLSRASVVATAIALADEDGLDALSMRRLGQRLSVDPMSLYNHVGDKDDLLDAMADGVVGEVDVPERMGVWSTDLRQTILAARSTMLRHSWPAQVLEGRRQPGPATLRYMDTIMDILRSGGLSLDLTHHAIHLLGSRVLGFSQDLFEDKAAERPDPAAAAAMFAGFVDTHPRVFEMAAAVSHEGGVGGCDDDVEFGFALDLILDGLERRARLDEPPAT